MLPYYPSNQIEDIISALLASTLPSSQTSSWNSSDIKSANSLMTNCSDLIQHSSHHLTSLLDAQNVALQKQSSRNNGVDASFIPRRGVVKESDIKGLRVMGGLLQVSCSRPSCDSAPVPASTVIQTSCHREFKSCHHCFTYYCSSKCRLSDWPRHKRSACPAGRAASQAKSVIRHILMSELHQSVSELACEGVHQIGRGCVVLWISDQFNLNDLRTLNPAYVSLKTARILVESVAPDSLSTVLDACSRYNPSQHMVVTVSVKISLPSQPHSSHYPFTRHRHPTAIKKCAILPLASCSNTRGAIRRGTFAKTSLFLTRLPRVMSTWKKGSENKEARISVVNALRQLEDRGVNLRRDHPDEYNKLLQYADGKQDFKNASSLYPIDKKTGKKFLVLLAPETSAYAEENESGRNSVVSELDALISVWNYDDCEVTGV